MGHFGNSPVFSFLLYFLAFSARNTMVGPKMQIQETDRQSRISSLAFIEGKGKLTGKGRQGYQSKTPEANTRNTQGC